MSDKKALFKFTSNTTTQGKWHFFLDEHWHHAFSEADCEKKIAMSRFRGSSDMYVCVHTCVRVCVHVFMRACVCVKRDGLYN